MAADLPPPFGALEQALAGDPDAVDEAFHPQAVLVDLVTGARLDGADEIRDHWGELAGRRARADIDEVLGDEERAAVRFTVRFHTDAHVYVRAGTLWAGLDGDRITEAELLWVERAGDEGDGG